MSNALRHTKVVVAAIILVVAIRNFVFTVYAIPDNSMCPTLLKGDRVMVNRWSYGLRTGDNKLFRYSRIVSAAAKKGDFIAYNSISDSLRSMTSRAVCIGRVSAVPGDTITIEGRQFIIPEGCRVCACRQTSPYLVDSPNKEYQILVPEENIIGRAFIIIYNLNKLRLRKDRWFRQLK